MACRQPRRHVSIAPFVGGVEGGGVGAADAEETAATELPLLEMQGHVLFVKQGVGGLGVEIAQHGQAGLRAYADAVQNRRDILY